MTGKADCGFFATFTQSDISAKAGSLNFGAVVISIKGIFDSLIS